MDARGHRSYDGEPTLRLKPDRLQEQTGDPMNVDYSTLREQKPFRWYVGSSSYALMCLTGTALGEYNLNPDACIEMHRKGRPLFRELFPDPAIREPSLSTPAVSYGHVNGLGSELRFPPAGELIHTPIYDSLREGVDALKQPVDFSQAGMAPFYLDFRRQLQDAFPGERVGFSFGFEGPITTAYELRGQNFLLDVMDEPELAAEFLEAVTASSFEFAKFYAEVNGSTAFREEGASMCDDVASMIPASLFPTLVMPFWEQYYRDRTSGVRSAHVEDLRAEQLPFLEQIGLSSFDPSISSKLSPPLIRDGCRVPFGWRLGSFHYLDMVVSEVRDWVFQTVADGASSVFTHIEALLCRDENVPKVNAFIAACREVQAMLESGATRDDLGAEVSASGRARFWDHWPE
ncbi:MAG: hypothetical protein KAI66_21935 [Lentisphaeria bacterium]|nr:hypothetical protein [Lentisphaeria bacterium]